MSIMFGLQCCSIDLFTMQSLGLGTEAGLYRPFMQLLIIPPLWFCVFLIVGYVYFILTL